MRRLLPALVLSLLAVLLLAGPTVAAEEPKPQEENQINTEGSDITDEEAAGEEDSLWTGLMLAAAAGTLFGIVVFLASGTKNLQQHHDEHEGEHAP